MPETTSKFRTLSGRPRAVEGTLLIALTLTSATWATQVHHHLPWAFFNEQFLGAFLGLSLASVFIAVKARGGEAGDRVPVFDWALSALGLVVGGYVSVMYPTIAYRLGELTTDRVALGTAAVLLVLEAARRLAGGTLAWVALGCILYAKFARLLPSLLYAKGSSWPRIVSYLYLDTNGVFGVPLQVAASVLVAFVFFGHALYAVRGDRFLMEIALVLMGRYRGGAAKVSVVSSALFGTVSGSAVANVAVNGAFSIPLMKQTGYPAHMAAAIEAVASTGGQIMPPVMGAAAFLIAEYLNISYGQVALAAAIPACLYYLALFTQVDLEAARNGLAGLPPERIPRLGAVMRHGWVFLVPLAVLVVTLMVFTWEPGPAGMAAVIVTFGVGMLQREHRPTLRRALASVEETGRTLLDIVAITALAGVVIGTLNLSGFIFKISMLLVTISGGHVFVLLLVTALGCLFLGLPLPTTVVYITLAVLIAPALVQAGVHPLAAHLFLFYFGMISLITPPDCLPTYTAAAMARADFWKTGWTGMRLAIAAYVVPFVFAFHPALILVGTWTDIVTTVFTAAVGTILISVGCAGYLFRVLGWGRRAAAIAAGLALFMPTVAGVPEYVFDVVGLGLAAVLVVWEWTARGSAVSASATVG
jgi:TRAP transporter 4TM/12TM fusion protein